MAQTKSLSLSVRRVTATLLAVVALGAGAAWYFDVPGASSVRPPANSLMVIAPYYYNGTWVFDDSKVLVSTDKCQYEVVVFSRYEQPNRVAGPIARADPHTTQHGRQQRTAAEFGIHSESP